MGAQAAQDWLAEQFEGYRPHLRAVALRLLGSPADAEEAVQEGWIRLSRADASTVANLGGWLTTVVARQSLNMLQARRSRPALPIGHDPDPVHTTDIQGNPEEQAVLADSVGLALIVVLDTLTPAERLAFVLHDMFAVPFDDIAPIVGRSPIATRQLASRARKRVKGTPAPHTDRARQREVVAAFLAASQHGDFDTLIALLAPDAVLHADDTAVRAGAQREARGPQAIAQAFADRTHALRLALIDGSPGIAWAPRHQPRAVITFTMADAKIIAIDLIGNPDHIRQLDVTIIDD